MSSGNSVRKGPWYEEEDERLRAFVAILGEKRWDSLAKASGLRRSGKSCRLRWLNYLRPCLKQGPITLAEERLIIQLHEKWGNKWADIARRLPGRTDNEIKNYWRTLVRKKIYMQNNNDNTNSSSEETSCSSYHTNCTSTSNYCQDASSLECNTKVEVINDANHNVEGVSVNDVVETETGFYHDRHWKGESEYTVTSSPYENRLSDWMSSLSSEQCDSMSSSDVYVWENNGFDYSCDWSHCEDTLWDVDLFNLNHMS